MNELNLIQMFLDASLIVQLVMIILLSASIVSWLVIFERWQFFNSLSKVNKSFDQTFWGSKDLEALHKINADNKRYGSTQRVFQDALLEYSRLKQDSVISVDDLDSVQRSIKVRVAKEEENFNKHLQLLANIGSVSPYIGLFGTVLGIVNSFVGLSDATQATINAVAPGISEALVATALGLFAAIPALLAYNRYVSLADKNIKSLLIFGEELVSILYREVTRK
ncbi:MAG: protein TolQ [Gammaproteobacteria bacterium]